MVSTQDVEKLKKALSDPHQQVWLDLDAPTSPELKLLEEVFQFHPLAIKDVIDMVGIPKIDMYENYIFMVLHRVFYRLESGECELREFEIFFSEKFIVTSHPKELSRTFQTARTQALEHARELTSHGTSYLLFRILRMAIQDHKPAIEAWQDELDHIEENVFHNANHGSAFKTNHAMLEKILTFKKLVARMRKSLMPEREALKELYDSKELTPIGKKNRPYFKMVLDNMNLLISELESLQAHANVVFETYAAMLTIRMTESSHQLNFVMQRLTIAASIFLPLTFIVGIYGMNFDVMPELHWKWGYWGLWGVMIWLSIAMLFFFRKKKWI